MSKDFPPPRSRPLTRREVVTGVAMLGAAGLPRAQASDRPINYLGSTSSTTSFPSASAAGTFVTNSGLVVAPEDQLALAVYSQLLTRVYYDGKVPIWLLIAYSADQTGFLQVHRPEFCYTAAGYQLSDFAPHRIGLGGSAAITTNSMTAIRDDPTRSSSTGRGSAITFR